MSALDVLIPMYLNQGFRSSGEEDICYEWQDKEGNTERVTVPLEVRSAESLHEKSVARFQDPELCLWRDDPEYPGQRYLLDKRFEDLTFRQQQAQRKLNSEVHGFEDYWILYFCESEIKELIARENRQVLETRQAAREAWEKTFNGQIWKIAKRAFSLIPTFPKDKRKVFYTCGTILGTTLATAFFLEPRSSGLRQL